MEKVYEFSKEDTKNIEKLIDDNNLVINHMVLPQGAGLPEHYSNSNVYMIIVRGKMTIHLDNHEAKKYMKGNIINIPYNLLMNVKNLDDEILEFFVVKAPNPKNFKEE